MADFLVSGGVTNALNVPSLSAEEAPKLRPYMALAEKLGSPQSFVAKVEGGERRLDLVEFIAIARALEADPLDLLARILGPVSADTAADTAP